MTPLVAVSPRPESAPAATVLSGSLADVRVDALIRLLGVRRHTGALVVVAGGDEARVFVSDGAVVGVDGWSTGSVAEIIDSLCRLRVGTFQFLPGLQPSKPMDPVAIDDVLVELDRSSARQSLPRASPPGPSRHR